VASVDSTKQHGAHVFDVNCRICSGSDDNKCPASLAFIQNNTPAHCEVASLPSHHVARKKICLAQRLKMYSAELHKSSKANSSVETDDQCISEMVSSVDANVTVQQTDVQKLMHSFEESMPNKPSTESEIPTAEKVQKETPVEWRNEDDRWSAVLHEMPPRDCVTDLTTQPLDQATWKLPLLQEVCVENDLIATRYVICCCQSRCCTSNTVL